MVFRYDTVKLGPPRRLDDGRLIVQATLTRTGVFVYRNPDGSERREYRAPDVVGRKDSLEGLKLAPVTNAHPPVMVTAENAKQYVVGQVGQDVHMDGKHVVATLVINDASTVREIEHGNKRETSCGYGCDLDETPGVSPDGERYDARQTNVQYNHLAIVEAGRAGSARIRMDGAEADTLFEVSPSAMSPGSVEDKHPRGDDTGSPVEELKKALAELAEQTKRADAEKTRADAADTKAKDLELKLAQAESDKAAEKTRADGEKSRADEAVKARKDADDAFEAKVQERASLQAEAIEYLGRNDKGETLSVDGKSTIDVSKMDARSLKCAIVEKLDGTKIDEKRSDEAVAFAHELAVDRAKKNSAAMGAARSVIVTGRNDNNTGNGDTEAQAKAASKARIANAWKSDAKETK